MKRLILFLSFLLILSSCDDMNEYRSADLGEYKILKKKQTSSRGFITYATYIFDGTEANWYGVSRSLYDSLQEGSTWKGIILTVEKEKKIK